MMNYEEKLQQVKCKHFINGEYVPSDGENHFDVINPSDEQVIGQAVTGSPYDVERAVKSAYEAFHKGEWRKMNDCDRGKILYKFADLLDENTEWLAYYETLNCGKPLKVSKNEDIPATAQTYRYFAGQTDKIKGHTIPMSKPFFGMTKK